MKKDTICNIQHKRYPLGQLVKVESIVYVNQVVFEKNYVFEGERHNFYELQYCLSGNPIIYQKNMFYQLSPGEITIFGPNDYHILYGDNKSESVLEIISFALSCGTEYISNKAIFNSTPTQRFLLDKILETVFGIFTPISHAADKVHLIKKPTYTKLREQELRNYLELLLISLIEKVQISSDKTKQKIHAYGEWGNKVKEYMLRNTDKNLTINKIANDLGISPSLLKKRYKKLFNSSIMHDFILYRAMRAKQYILDTKMKIYEISELMGFDNVYYFSYFIKRIFSKSPLQLRSEYKQITSGR